MWLRKLFFVLLVAFCLQPVVAQENKLTSQYLTIRDKLTDLKKNSELVTEQLRTVTEDLKASQQEAKQWEETSMTLSNSLTSINEQLNDAYKTIEQQAYENKKLKKTLTSCILILTVLIVAVLVVLYLELTHKTNFI